MCMVIGFLNFVSWGRVWLFLSWKFRFRKLCVILVFDCVGVKVVDEVNCLIGGSVVLVIIVCVVSGVFVGML